MRHLSLPLLLLTLLALPDEEQQQLLPGLPQGATLADYDALPPNYLHTLLAQLAREQRRHLAGGTFTSRLELANGRLLLLLRSAHLVAQLARPEQPKVILDATINTELLQALFPGTPIQIERPAIAGGAKVIQVISRDWAKTTLRGKRLAQWYDAVAARIRPGRPTLVVCTLAHEEGLRAMLHARPRPGCRRPLWRPARLQRLQGPRCHSGPGLPSKS